MHTLDGDMDTMSVLRNKLSTPIHLETATSQTVIYRQSKHETGDTQRVSLTVESPGFRRVNSGSLREHKLKQTQVVETCSQDGKMSPNLTVQRRRSKDLNSSQESLSSPGLQRSSSRASSTDLRESDEGNKDGSPSHNSANCSRSASPDKPHNTFESPSCYNSFSDGGDLTEFGTNSGIGLLAPFEKRPSSAQDNYETNNSRPNSRSFERSLDNILDKCSEKSLDLNLSVDSWNSSALEGGKSPDQHSSGSAAKGSKSEKKKNRWYNNEMDKRKFDSMRSKKTLKRRKQIMSTTYKSRSEDYRRMFKDVPKDERLIVDYSCALQKDILVQGRMYISQNWICFYAKIFNWETMLMIPCKEITAITKEKTARVIPNAIQITTEKERYFFTSFGARDKTYMMLFRIWQNALLDQPMSAKELWTWIHYNYGDDLGLTTEDEDYVPPQSFEELSEKLKEEIPIIKELQTDSEALTTTADNIQTASNEDTDAFVSDEVFNQPLLTDSIPIVLSKAHLAKLPDFLDSSDDSEGEYFCAGHDHLEKMYLDEVFSINIDTVFECLFTDSPFFRHFVSSRKTFDLHLPNWEEEPDENGNKVRNITYTLTLNNSIGPKTSPSTEKQICYTMSKPGRIYHVDCECCNGGIPYADSFYVLLRYCLTRVSPIKCRVVVTGELKYKKHVLGMFKGMIEKSAVNGLTDYCRQLSVHLRREAERQEAIVVGHQNIIPKKKVRRKRVKVHAASSDSAAASRQQFFERQTSTPPSPSKALYKDEKLIELNAHTLVRVIIVVLVLLLLFNAVLFYKLWSLESYASSLYGTPSQESIESLSKYPRTQEEWSQLLQQQKHLHESEINKWEEVLATSINIVEQMKASLLNLQKSLRAGSPARDEH
ncbi:protein Aster-B-like isoform X2 [Physella acuta]|uniref:protein Aster-B-like isoform X2 n=1 Tax=Physella acuta TaxID=109671 RepID=UPI0027DBD5EC|nr:protein Aster-B-like isoform X2 [Physella acuta]